MLAHVRRALLAAAWLSALPALLPSAVQAQSYPERAIRLTVGFPPGSGPDVVARLVGQQLAENLKQTVVVDNRAGAGGQIAANAVAKSLPDGYSLLLAEVGSISIAPPAFSKLPYDPAKELQVLTEVVRSDFLLVVPAASPHRTVADFLNAHRGSRERVNFATFGAGTPGHFGAELLGTAGGFPVEPIHYRSTGDAVSAIAKGEVAGAFVSTALGAAQVKGGTMRALASTAAARVPQLPEVPTFIESHVRGIDVSAWFAFFVPAGTPASVAELLARQLVAAVQADDVKRKLTEAGFSVTGTSPVQAQQMVRAEAERWAGIVRKTGFKGD
ncbi:tripartite tricarboxylate transporter substrate-binding protein [Schlegelella sp. S2-27]|uniref:Tripartite tricarboxylate transporter substrate-binding protein n=1 Tax=Caldimonas mangrovi TaxID=2944811 RepID=A0ABT0YUK4_9BURK|nr:tripartite tricarboxylate transporter substrate-binding protein [Caldimonas mangrovi]MCM5682433.1 tripartite tricarboxylate transporter substrate-binding protein [Caldimonas mangrovi]